MTGYHYTILGAGRQGTAAAYDLARYGSAARIELCDMDLPRAQAAAMRVNKLSESELCHGQALDVLDPAALRRAMEPADVTLSAVPYKFNLAITQAALEVRTSLCDMGGYTEIVRQQIALAETARQAGISLVPDCGMGPGLVNTLGAFAYELLDEPHAIAIYDAGLPQQPNPPWNYELTFHINGLTNEMDGEAIFIRDGQITFVPTLSEPEMIDFPGLGELEADVTSGGTSLAPWTFLGKLERYENKVLRYPGHFEWLRAFKTLGLFSETPVRVGESTVVPRQVYHALLEPQITRPDTHDICVMRAVGTGRKDGRERTVTIDLVDRYDPHTGFTGMERLTGWHCAIMMGFQARMVVPPGAWPVELALPASDFMVELPRRGIPYTVEWSV